MPQGANTGMLINVLKNAGSQLDYVFVVRGWACMMPGWVHRRCAWWQVAVAPPLHTTASSQPINQLVCLVGKSWIAPLRLPPQPTRCVLPHHQMSYDAGDANTTGYNPVEAIQAYCSYHPCNRVLGGIQIPPEVSVPARLPRMLPQAVWVGPQPAGGQAGADLTAGLTRHGLIAGMGRR
jgi:hypothetical protein